MIVNLVCHREKQDPAPSREELGLAAALAVVRMIDDPEIAASHAEALEIWERDHYTKVMLTARASRWEAVLQIPGLTAEVGAAEVRALVPCPKQDRGAAVKKMQALSEEMESRPLSHRPTAWTLAANPQLAMSSGKHAAQCAHAAHLLYRSMTATERDAWRSERFVLNLVSLSPPEWAEILPGAAISVIDAGRTELPPGSVTVLAFRRDRSTTD